MTLFQNSWRDSSLPVHPLSTRQFAFSLWLKFFFVWQFFFRLFADCEKDPPQLDYTQMLLYFACHPDSTEGVYRALSVAIGTHVFQPIEMPNPVAEKVIVFQK